MSIAAGGDVTQFDTFQFIGTPEDSMLEQELTIEAQETRDIVSIVTSYKVLGFTESDADEGAFWEGQFTMSLGQPMPKASPGEYRSGVRMPVNWNYNMALRTDTDTPRTAGGFAPYTREWLGDPAVSFLWQQGETLFINHNVIDEIGDQFAGFRLDGTLAYTPA